MRDKDDGYELDSVPSSPPPDEHSNDSSNGLLPEHNAFPSTQPRGLRRLFSIFSSTTSETTTSRRTAYIDGLRGVAAVLIYFFHSVGQWHVTSDNGFGSLGANLEPIRLPFIRLLYGAGHPAVTIFFVCSGYVLSTKALKLMHSDDELVRAEIPGILASSMLKRPVRLFPPVYAVSLMVTLASAAGVPAILIIRRSFVGSLVKWAQDSWRISNLFFLNGTSQLEIWDHYNPIDWTIPLEFRCSLFVYLLLLACSRIRNSRKRILFIMAWTVWSFLLGCWPVTSFFAGVAIAELDIRREMKRDTEDSRNWFWIFVLGLFLASNPAPTDPEEAAFGYGLINLFTPKNMFVEDTRFWSTIAGITVFLSLTRLPFMKSLLSKSIPQWLGRISFAFYLVHGPVMWIVSGLLSDRVPGVTPASSVTSLWYFETFFFLLHFVQLPITFWIATLVDRFVVMPSARLSVTLEKRLTT